jgi:putative endonuclease
MGLGFRREDEARECMFYVYLPAGRPHETLCAGVTCDLAKRVWGHKNKAVPGFTARYGVDTVV